MKAKRWRNGGESEKIRNSEWCTEKAAQTLLDEGGKVGDMKKAQDLQASDCGICLNKNRDRNNIVLYLNRNE